MRYVILRDDDTNAFTPVACLERLYRPALEQGLPVNLAAIPAVATDTHMPDGRLEGFLLDCPAMRTTVMPLAANPPLVEYLRGNPGYHLVQHGLHHDYLEFERAEPGEISRRLEQGTRLLKEAGFPRPKTFVAPYDKLSRASLVEVQKRFPVLSTGWYELRRLPLAWWPGYAWKKVRGAAHWRIGQTLLLSHPGCLLSSQRAYSTMLSAITHYVNTGRLTVLVTHWWEYFRNGSPDEPFIEFLHETTRYLATHPDIKVISFADLLEENLL